MSKLRLIFTALSFLAILVIYVFIYAGLQSSIIESESENETTLYSTAIDNNLTEDQKFMDEQLELANYCETAADCVDAGSFCPLACQNFVNISRVDDIKKLMSIFEQTCELDCLITTPVCKSNKCVVD